jgi:hypothetical protein
MREGWSKQRGSTGSHRLSEAGDDFAVEHDLEGVAERRLQRLALQHRRIQPGFNLGMLVGAIVVRDQMESSPTGTLRRSD